MSHRSLGSLGPAGQTSPVRPAFHSQTPGLRSGRHLLLLLAVGLAAALPTNAQEKPAANQSAEQLLKRFRDEFIAIQPGQGRFPKGFTMGSEVTAEQAQPKVPVQFDYTFQIARYEVPQNLWEAVMGQNPSRWKGPRNSVEMLTFAEAQEFCRRVTKQMVELKLIDASQEVRLPSEAEWEYAARAGTKTVYSFGDDVQQLGKYAWFTGNAAGNDPPVGALQPNPWGLYDVHGYLWEWCADRGHGDLSRTPRDGTPAAEGGRDGLRVLRGGSWKDPARQLTSSFRRLAAETLKDDAVGLRCVLAARR